MELHSKFSAYQTMVNVYSYENWSEDQLIFDEDRFKHVIFSKSSFFNELLKESGTKKIMSEKGVDKADQIPVSFRFWKYDPKGLFLSSYKENVLLRKIDDRYFRSNLGIESVFAPQQMTNEMDHRSPVGLIVLFPAELAKYV